MSSDLGELKQQYRRSLEAFIQGDPEPQKALWSQGDDVTLANPLGPPAKGIDRVLEAMDRAAAMTRDGTDLTFDVVSSYETEDLAYEFGLQGGAMRLGDSPDMVRISLRVTTIFRREDGGWKLLHRHADPITDRRPIESLAQPGSGVDD
jgi:ketosteroid isomerase-like protein